MKNYSNRANICIDCKKACGGCPWSEKFEPVPGWEAQKVSLNVGDRRFIETYSITACPLFDKDEKQTGTCGEMSDADFRSMMAIWKWREARGM